MGKRLRRPLFKKEIVEAQENAKSAAGAARYLGVDPRTYKKYAQEYGIYEDLLNKRGIGVNKGFAKTKPHSTKLRDIFENQHPEYPLQRLKWRMVARNLIEDRCEICGTEEERISDGKKPLMMTFREEHGDYSPANLQILCYNCIFLTKDAPTVANKSHIKNSLTKEKPKVVDRWVNPDPKRMGLEPEDDLTDEEIAELKRQIDIELGRV